MLNWPALLRIHLFHSLADAVRRLPTTPPDLLTELLPDVWFLTHAQAARKRAA